MKKIIVMIGIFWGMNIGVLPMIQAALVFGSYTQQGARAWECESKEEDVKKMDIEGGNTEFFDVRKIRFPNNPERRYEEIVKYFIGWKYPLIKSKTEQNQDRVLVKELEGVNLFGVFDGAGDAYGEKVAQLVSDKTLEIIVKDTGKVAVFDDSKLRTAIFNAFKESNKAYMSKREWADGETTGLVVLVTAEKVCVGNIGDSRAILVKKDHSSKVISPENIYKFRAINTDVDDLLKKHRITQLHENNPERAITNNPNDAQELKRLLKKGIPAALAYDDDLKKSIKVINRLPDDTCIILMTDGVYNVLDNDVIAEIAVTMMENHKGLVNNVFMNSIAQEIIKAATSKLKKDYARNPESYARDDMAVIVVKLEDNLESLLTSLQTLKQKLITLQSVLKR